MLQRWRYALGPAADGELARVFPGPPPLVLAGDAIAGGKIEGAWLSGRAAAQALLR
jgi:predicted NAD/FAD-dependent oxidoreductase